MAGLVKEQRSTTHTAPLGTKRDAQLEVQIDALLAGRHADPFALLGPHPVSGGWSARVFLPWAAEASISLKGAAKVTDAVKLRPEGFFEATWPSSQATAPAPASYKIQGRTHQGEPFEIYDPYAFPYLLTEFDLHLMSEGRHSDAYQKLGAHVKTLEDVAGVHFAVCAPRAKRVSVVGDFIRLDGSVHPLRSRRSSTIS